MSQSNTHLMARLTPIERNILQRWQFWLYLATSHPKQYVDLLERCITWTSVAHAEGLMASPPWLIIMLGLSLSPQLDDREYLHKLLGSSSLSLSAQTALNEIHEQWVMGNLQRSDWRLAQRKLLIIPSVHQPSLTGFCIAKLLKDLSTIDNLQIEPLDLTTLRLLKNLIKSPPQEAFDHLIKVESAHVIAFHIALNHDHRHQSLPTSSQHLGLIEHFEDLYTPSRRVLYHRLAHSLKRLGSDLSKPLYTLKTVHFSNFSQEVEHISLIGGVNALGKSGSLEQVSHSEWCMLGEEIGDGIDYFMLKWAERELLYFQRETWRYSGNNWHISWGFHELSSLIHCVQADLSLLSWLHLVSVWTSQALDASLELESLVSEWNWDPLDHHQKERQLLQAEIEVFTLFNPISSTEPVRKNGTDYTSLSVSFSTKMLARVHPNQLHICVNSEGDWRIQLHPLLSRKVKLATDTLSAKSIRRDDLSNHNGHYPIGETSYRYHPSSDAIDDQTSTPIRSNIHILKLSELAHTLLRLLQEIITHS